MNLRLGFVKPGLLVLLMMTLSGCFATSIDPGPVAVSPQLPELPDRLRQQCRDPGVDPDAIVALITHRVALAECRRLHVEVVRLYIDTRRGLAGNAQ